MRETVETSLKSNAADLLATPLPEAEDEQAAVGDAGWALPLLGGVLLISPIIRIAASDQTFFGAPSAVAYIFAVWGGLIILASRLARRARRAELAARRREERMVGVGEVVLTRRRPDLADKIE